MNGSCGICGNCGKLLELELVSPFDRPLPPSIMPSIPFGLFKPRPRTRSKKEEQKFINNFEKSKKVFFNHIYIIDYLFSLPR